MAAAGSATARSLPQRPRQQDHDRRHHDRRHEQQAGPGKAENALMIKLDALAGDDDHDQRGQHHERRHAADRQRPPEQDRDDRRQQSRKQARSTFTKLRAKSSTAPRVSAGSGSVRERGQPPASTTRIARPAWARTSAARSRSHETVLCCPQCRRRAAARWSASDCRGSLRARADARTARRPEPRSRSTGPIRSSAARPRAVQHREQGKRHEQNERRLAGQQKQSGRGAEHVPGLPLPLA